MVTSSSRYPTVLLDVARLELWRSPLGVQMDELQEVLKREVR
jgi:hypothetical protein